MPPWLDSAEEVAAVATAVVVAVGAVAATFFTALAGVWAVWRAKIKPLLTETKHSANRAAEQLVNNHGSSTRDAIDRIEMIMSLTAADVREIRADQRTDRETASRAHSEIFRRIRALETPMEDTRP
jgi:hypothetical protein